MKKFVKYKSSWEKGWGPGEGEDPSCGEGSSPSPGIKNLISYTFMKAIMSSETSSAKMA